MVIVSNSHRQLGGSLSLNPQVAVRVTPIVVLLLANAQFSRRLRWISGSYKMKLYIENCWVGVGIFIVMSSASCVPTDIPCFLKACCSLEQIRQIHGTGKRHGSVAYLSSNWLPRLHQRTRIRPSLRVSVLSRACRKSSGLDRPTWKRPGSTVKSSNTVKLQQMMRTALDPRLPTRWTDVMLGITRLQAPRAPTTPPGFLHNTEDGPPNPRTRIYGSGKVVKWHWYPHQTLGEIEAPLMPSIRAILFCRKSSLLPPPLPSTHPYTHKQVIPTIHFLYSKWSPL